MMRRVIASALSLCIASGAYAQTGTLTGASVKATGGTTARTLGDRAADIRNVKDFGAASNEATGSDGTVSAGTNAFCSAATTFTAGDAGKTIIINGSGSASVDQTGTITGYISQHCVTTSFTAATATPWQNMLKVQSIGTAQSGAGSYAPGDTLTVVGGTNVTTAAVATVGTTQVASATVNAAGSGGNNGTCTLTGTTGTAGIGKSVFSASATISGGAITAINSITVPGIYITNPTSLAAEPVTSSCGGLTGATLTLKMGVQAALVTTQGHYGAFPANPVSTTTSGAGTGATLTLYTANAGGLFAYGTDDSAAVNAAVAAVSNAGGGAIALPAGRTLMLSALNVPYSGSTPVQANVRITGAGDSSTGYEAQSACRTAGCPSIGTAGSFLDMRYAGGDGSHIAKIDVRGGGVLEMDHLTLIDGGTSNFQMIFTTNTTLKFHDIVVSGNPTCYAESCQQNAFQLGPIVAPTSFYTNLSTAPFQGYGTVIRDAVFDHIAVAAALGASVNEVIFDNDRVTWTCGTSGSRSAAYVLYGAGLGSGSNRWIGGYVEMGGYQYAVNTITSGFAGNVTYNSFYSLGLQDEVPGSPSLGYAYFDNNAFSNGILSDADPVFANNILNGPGQYNTIISLSGKASTFGNGINVAGQTIANGPMSVNTTASPSKALQVGGGTGTQIVFANGGNSGNNNGPAFTLGYNSAVRGGFGGRSAIFGGSYDSRTLVYGYDGLVFDAGNNDVWQLTTAGEFLDLTVALTSPVTGGTVTIATGVQRQIIAPAGALASLTVALPACNTGNNGMVKKFSFSQAITALTVSAVSGSVVAAPASAAAGDARGFVCYGAGASWYPST